ncbi:MAG: hypothetical protein M1827_003800 [Pycnora praestabilis]|nr:MAG: hypothetical protein M1827_003800 [Pycnora praestabilis]
MAVNGPDGGHSDGINGQPTYTVPLLIAGKEVHSETTIDVMNPSTGEVLWRSSSASKSSAVEAVEAAHKAFPQWAKTKPSKKRDIFLKAADILQCRAKELSGYMKEETGAEDPFTDFNIANTTEMLKDVAGRISSVQGSIPTVGDEGANALVFKEPYGVVLGIAPWNAPYILGMRSVAYALAAGNTTVLKGPELSPRCYWGIATVLAEAGLPAGCLNFIVHRPADAAEITTALIEHPAIKKINFTGSTAVGSIIAATAGKNLKPVLMELGGKASAIVLEDANLERAAQACALGSFLHAGQICMSTERIIVHSSISRDFSEVLKAAIKNIFGSDTAQVLVTPAGVKKNQKLAHNAFKSGAKVMIGSADTEESSDTRMRPIVIEGVTKEMDLYYQESFGPSVSYMTVDSEAEAIELANDTEYGLTASVFTENLGTGLRVAKQIESGAVHINQMTVHDEPSIPHGGMKKSGFGRFNAHYGFEEFLRTKTITFQD